MNKELFKEYYNLIGAQNNNESWTDEFTDRYVDSTFITYEDSYIDESDGTGFVDNSY